MESKKKKITKTVVTTIEEEIVDEVTHIICILDRSGSMSNIIKDSIGGFNTFLEKQKELSTDAYITVVLFDDKYDMIHKCIDLKEIKPMTNKIWYPRGSTALYDAIGKTINNDYDTEKNIDKTLVCIVTDGEENYSKEYKNEDIKKLIKQKESEGWNFIYLGANQDAFKVGTNMGISSNNTYTYYANTDGVMDMSAVLASAAISYRVTNSASDTYDNISKNLLKKEEEK